MDSTPVTSKLHGPKSILLFGVGSLAPKSYDAGVRGTEQWNHVAFGGVPGNQFYCRQRTPKSEVDQFDAL